MKKIKVLLSCFLLLFTIGCSSTKNETNSKVDNKVSTNEEVAQDPKTREYLVDTYFKIQEGDSFDEIQHLISKEGISIKDSGEFDSQKGYKKREVSILEGNNKLDLVFRDDKLGAKTFTYNTNDSNSTWFYSNYYDTLDNTNTNEETHGLWENGVKPSEFDTELELNSYINENI